MRVNGLIDWDGPGKFTSSEVSYFPAFFRRLWVVLLDWEGLQESKSNKCLRRDEEITSTDKSNAGVA